MFDIGTCARNGIFGKCALAQASAAQLFAEGTRYSVAARSFLSSSESASLALQALGTCSPQRSAGVGDEARNYDLLLLAASSASNASLAFGKAECWRLAAQAAQSCIESLTAAAATATDSGAIAAHPPPISASQRQSLSSGSFPSRVRPSASRRASSREPLLPPLSLPRMTKRRTPPRPTPAPVSTARSESETLLRDSLPL